MGKKSLQDEINEFLMVWDCETMNGFFREIADLFDLYNVEEEDDWVKDEVGDEDERTIRLIRTVYLISRIAEFHAGKLCTLKMQFRDLWKRMIQESANV